MSVEVVMPIIQKKIVMIDSLRFENICSSIHGHVSISCKWFDRFDLLVVLAFESYACELQKLILILFLGTRYTGIPTVLHIVQRETEWGLLNYWRIK